MINIFLAYYDEGMFTILTWAITILLPIVLYKAFKNNPKEASYRLTHITLPTILVFVVAFFVFSDIRTLGTLQEAIDIFLLTIIPIGLSVIATPYADLIDKKDK